MEPDKIIIIVIAVLICLGGTWVWCSDLNADDSCKVWAEQWDDLKKINESAKRLIESTSCTENEYEKAIKALREPITFIEPTPDQEKLMEAILNKPLLSANEIRESMNMSPLRAEDASLWEERNAPEFREIKKEPKGHLLALKCETCGGELNVIRNSFHYQIVIGSSATSYAPFNKTFYVCKYCGNKYILMEDKK